MNYGGYSTAPAPAPTPTGINIMPNYGAYMSPYQQYNNTADMYQERLNQEMQRHPQYANYMAQQSQQTVTPVNTQPRPTKVMMVKNIDDAKNYAINFDNTLYIFIHENNETGQTQIYTREFDLESGRSNFRQFAPNSTNGSNPVAAVATTAVVTTQDTLVNTPSTNDALYTKVTNLETTVESLSNELNALKGGINNVQSNATTSAKSGVKSNIPAANAKSESTNDSTTDGSK